MTDTDSDTHTHTHTNQTKGQADFFRKAQIWREDREHGENSNLEMTPSGSAFISLLPY